MTLHDSPQVPRTNPRTQTPKLTMFDKLKNIASLMGNAGQLKEKFAQMQEELGRKTVDGEAGAGAVRVTVNGRFEVLRVQLDQSMLQTLLGPMSEPDAAVDANVDAAAQQLRASDDLHMIEDLIKAATNAAMFKARDLVKDEMREITGGMDIPGLDGMM